MKTSISIVREDRLINVEGYIITVDSFDSLENIDTLPAKWRAIQFHEGKGDIEYFENGNIHNKSFESHDYSKYLQAFVSLWEERKYSIENPPEPSLEVLKELKYAEINAKRDSLELSGFEYLGSVFDTDEKSYMRIIGADNLAMKSVQANQPFSIEWTLADNTKKTMNAEEMLGLLPAFALYSDSLHKKASLLKEEVENALTKEAIKAIVWV